MGARIALTVYTFNPLEDPRWAEFVQRHPRASVFHTPGWLEALRRTHGYEPVVYTTSLPTANLTNGVVFSRISSRLTGRRMVSLPFSDHCEPLVGQRAEMESLLALLVSGAERKDWKYVELRPRSSNPSGLKLGGEFEPSETFYLHQLDLRPTLEDLFRHSHKSCVQRKIHRAEREVLTYEEGKTKSLLAKFYHLLRMTRGRHGLPPQPLVWFRNLIECLGDSLAIRVASKRGEPIASILTLTYKNTVVYKYGCSDARFHNLGGMPFLFWRTIQEAKKLGFEEFDLGRSDTDNPGLITFKDHFGALRSRLTYYRFPPGTTSTATKGWKLQIAKKLFAHMPGPVLTTAGRLLYRHIG